MNIDGPTHLMKVSTKRLLTDIQVLKIVRLHSIMELKHFLIHILVKLSYQENFKLSLNVL